MSLRLRLIDFRTSRAPVLLGLCQGDISSCAQYVNSAQQRLLLCRENSGESWWGTWVNMIFNVNRLDPFITLPNGIARLENITVCDRPIRIQGPWYEFLDYGIGYQEVGRCCQFLQMYDRGMFPSFVDLIPGYKIRAMITDSSDVGKRALIQGTDTNDHTIYTQDGLATVQGEYLDFDSPFVDTDDGLAQLTGIQKDITNAPVNFYQVNPTTGDQTLIVTMEPSEKTASYRRYQLAGMPKNCCDPITSPSTTVQVRAIAKLDFVPVRVDTDYLIIQNLEALTEECQSIRFEGMDTGNAATLAKVHHSNAIGLLNGQLNHLLGKDRPSSIVAVFGSARLRRQGVGLVI